MGGEPGDDSQAPRAITVEGGGRGGGLRAAGGQVRFFSHGLADYQAIGEAFGTGGRELDCGWVPGPSKASPDDPRGLGRDRRLG